MDTPVALIDPTPILKELEQLVSGAQSLVETREGYAKDYAYDALIKCRHNNDPKAATKAAQNAFWHDGSRDGYMAAVYALTTVQKLLLTLMAEARARAEAKQDSPIS